MMESAPQISVIIPAYNAAATLSATLDSVLAQTYSPVDILVIDDGSQDDTARIASEYAPQVRLLRQQNAGPGAARNHGAREAKGDWLAFLDADDTWLPEKLEKQLPYTSDPQVAMIHCCASSHWCLSEPGGISFEVLWKRNPVVLSTSLVRRLAFEQVEGFSEERVLDTVSDYNLWLRLAGTGWKIATCPEALFRYTCGDLSRQLERYLYAEIANAEKISEQFSLAKTVLHSKRTAIYEESGRSLLNARNMRMARTLFQTLLREQPTISRFLHWAATFTPSSILDLRRNLLMGKKTKTLKGTIRV